MYQSHLISSCTKSALIRTNIAKFIHSIHSLQSLKKDSCCFNCFLPVTFCKDVKENETDDCIFKDILATVAVAAFSYKKELKFDQISIDTTLNHTHYTIALCKYRRMFDTDAIVMSHLITHVFTQISHDFNFFD